MVRKRPESFQVSCHICEFAVDASHKNLIKKGKWVSIFCKGCKSNRKSSKWICECKIPWNKCSIHRSCGLACRAREKTFSNISMNVKKMRQQMSVNNNILGNVRRTKICKKIRPTRGIPKALGTIKTLATKVAGQCISHSGDLGKELVLSGADEHSPEANNQIQITTNNQKEKRPFLKGPSLSWETRRVAHLATLLEEVPQVGKFLYPINGDRSTPPAKSLLTRKGVFS